MRLGQPFYLCDSAVYKLVYELMVKQFGKTLSGKEKEGMRVILKLILGIKLQPICTGRGTH